MVEETYQEEDQTKMTPQQKAEQDIKQWLDAKRVSNRKREEYADQIQTLQNEIEDGNLRLDEEGNLIQTLKFPFKSLTELKYKQRLTKGDVQPYMKGVNSQDGDARVQGYICALTDQPHGLIDKLDTEDMEIPNSIAVFFIA
jgi:anthranilate/para-aminobenzoate synthase component I